jgi:hypothetical protein
MAVQASSQVTNYEATSDDDPGCGWIVFAGVLLMILGTLNVVEGLAAINSAHFFVGNAHYIAGDLNTCGWVALCIGVIEWVVGVAVFVKNQFARWTGVVVLSANAIAQLLMIPAYPFWSLCIFALDILGIYGLVAYGSRIAQG